MADSWTGPFGFKPITGTLPSSEQGRKIHDRGIFLKAMEWSPAKFHDIGIILHIMEGFPEKCHGMGIIFHIMEGFLEKCRGMGIYFAYHGKVSRKVP